MPSYYFLLQEFDDEILVFFNEIVRKPELR